MLATLVLAIALHGCLQRIDVAAATPRSTTGRLSLLECGRRVAGPWTARLGRSGLSTHHREGDGTTPLGTFELGPVLNGLDPNPGMRLRYHPPRLRRLVGRGPGFADLQPVP